jgi:hypothetical protein
VTCNLDPSAEASQGEIVFASRAGLVPAGHVIHVELGRMPMAWTAHAKWFALAALATLIVAGTAVVFARPRRSPTVECSDASIPAHPLPSPELPAKSKRRTDRQRRRAA